MKRVITLVILFAAIILSVDAQVQKNPVKKVDRDSIRVNNNKKYKPSKDSAKVNIRIDSVSNNQIDHKKL